MEKKIVTRRKAKVNSELCVACGSCVKVCPKGAVSVWNGAFAIIDRDICVGCMKCQRECPASVIEMEVVTYEKALV